jgi:moderate conductance mechanosensitive channel
MAGVKRSVYLILVSMVCAASVLVTAAKGQSASSVGSKPKANQASVKLPDPLTREAIRDVISTLDDGQVRKLLIKRLSEQADARARVLSQKDNRSLSNIIAGYGDALVEWHRVTMEKTFLLPSLFANSIAAFDQRRGNGSYFYLFLCLVAAVGAGTAAYFLVSRITAGVEQRIFNATPATLGQKLILITERLMLRIGQIVAFVLVGYGASVMMTAPGSPDRYTVWLVVRTIGWIWLIIALARFVLAPTQPALRLCPVDDRSAGFLVWRTGVVASIVSIGFGVVRWMHEFGQDPGEMRLGFWMALAANIVIVATIWQDRQGIRAMLADDRDRGTAWYKVAYAWPAISIGLVVVHWLVISVVVATSKVTAGIGTTMMITLALLVCLPLIDHALRAIVLNMTAAAEDDEDLPLLAAHRETQKGMIRCGRVLLGLAIITGLLRLWDVDIFSLAAQGGGARFAGALIDISIILLLAYAAWELVTIVTQRQIAIERAAMGMEEGAEVMADGEGGKGESRLATILPLVRLVIRIAIGILAGLMIVSELGVNITPLLAGAGIVGLAIGFGAQTLVKDIISGLFFLIDDAFRKGEYIDIGNVKGTVEKISVRSMQLRHHNGPLNTVPFGEINFITNFSRDWVVMKLPFRLTYDTDAEAVRKMIKKLGQELLEDPVLGPVFLQPLKSQGVIQMEDSAMIMRVKFMTRPGDQWVIRRIVFAKIRDLFEANGIKFAHREVTVRLPDHDETKELSERESQAIAAAARSAISEAPRA